MALNCSQFTTGFDLFIKIIIINKDNGPIARYYINWPQEIDIPSEPSESTTFFTIGFSLRRALTKPKRTSIEPQFVDRKAKNFCIFNDLAKLKELETIEVINSVDMKRDSQKSKCLSV
jgi:hypothetical protein